MEFKILEQKENKLIPRKEIKVDVSYDGATPKNDEVRKKIAEHFKIKEELVRVNQIWQNFGLRNATVQANVYDNLDTFKKYEEIKKKVKEKKEVGKSQPAQEAKPAAAAEKGK